MDEDQELKAKRERIAEARRKREAMVAAREKRAEAARLDAELALEEQRLRDEPEIDKAIAEHGPLGIKTAVVETPLGAIVVKRPNHLHYKRFLDKASTKTDDLWALVRTCIVYPDVAKVNAICEEYPALVVTLADACVDLAGHRKSELAPK